MMPLMLKSSITIESTSGMKVNHMAVPGWIL